MGEFARINEGFVFWQKYEPVISSVDASLVAPVLESAGATLPRTKWLGDSNAYRCDLGAKQFEFVFDLRDDQALVVDIEVFRTRADERVKVGHISVPWPCESWEAPQAQLRALL